MSSARIKRKRKTINITCEYCIKFNKECKYSDKDSKICNDFVVCKELFCDKCGYWLDFIVCVNRLNTKHKKCWGCKQSKIIKKIIKREQTNEGYR